MVRANAAKKIIGLATAATTKTHTRKPQAWRTKRSRVKTRRVKRKRKRMERMRGSSECTHACLHSSDTGVEAPSWALLPRVDGEAPNALTRATLQDQGNRVTNSRHQRT